MTINEKIKRVIKNVKAFSKECEEAEYTDTGEAWEHINIMLNTLTEAQKALKPRTLCVEIEGGVLQQVHGMRPGDDYELADWDELEDIGANNDILLAELHEKIKRATAQNV